MNLFTLIVFQSNRTTIRLLHIEQFHLYDSACFFSSNCISCFICSTRTTISCSDPFNGTAGNVLQQAGFEFCSVRCFSLSLSMTDIPVESYFQKKISANGFIVRSGHSTCPTDSLNGIQHIFCCSTRDLCNRVSSNKIDQINMSIAIFLSLFLSQTLSIKFWCRQFISTQTFLFYCVHFRFFTETRFLLAIAFNWAWLIFESLKLFSCPR